MVVIEAFAPQCMYSHLYAHVKTCIPHAGIHTYNLYSYLATSFVPYKAIVMCWGKRTQVSLITIILPIELLCFVLNPGSCSEQRVHKERPDHCPSHHLDCLRPRASGSLAPAPAAAKNSLFSWHAAGRGSGALESSKRLWLNLNSCLPQARSQSSRFPLPTD